ncbi:MAG: hypothetical protein F6K41_35335, partial [Symploca sp. SIO3E6]|nr:hypothetical protein [Caldora sp. SIO3E6]
HDGNVNKSAGQEILAPASGYVYFSDSYPDFVCLSIDANRSLSIGHIDRSPSLTSGAYIEQDTVLGTLSYANSINGGYAHIHIEGKNSSNCGGTSIPFTEANGLRFNGVGDLPDLLGENDHFRMPLTRP